MQCFLPLLSTSEDPVLLVLLKAQVTKGNKLPFDADFELGQTKLRLVYGDHEPAAERSC